MLKISPLFKKFLKLHGQITPEFFGLRMRSFQVIVFMETQTHKEIFKSALAYL